MNFERPCSGSIAVRQASCVVMEYIERKNEVPSGVLTSLEDLTSDLLDLQELILTLARAADRLPIASNTPPPETGH